LGIKKQEELEMKKYLISVTTVCLALMMGVSSVSAFVPPGLAKKGDLPPGIQKRFIQQEKDIKEYQTTIKDINVKERRIVIEDGTAILSLLVSNKANIQLNKKTVKFEDLRKNDEVVIKLDKDNTATEVKATRKQEVQYTVQGKLLLISKDQNRVYIYEDANLTNYELKSDVIVKLNGEKTNFNNLTTGMNVKLTIEGDKVRLIEATKDVNTKINGTIIGIDYNKLEVVLQEGTKATLYKAKSSTPIKIDDKTSTFKNLLVGMELEAYVIDQNIVSINGKSLAIESQKGIVKSINLDRKEIVLTQGSKETLFKINNSVIVNINGVLKALKDVTVNTEAQLTIQNGQVIEIKVNALIQSFEGRIIAKDIGTKPSITIQIGNEVKVFLVKTDLNIVGIEVGKEYIIHVKDNEVIVIAIK